MGYIPITPFRRPMTAAHLKPAAPAPALPANKWELLRQLACARTFYGLSDRDLSVLQALLGFYPETDLAPGPGLIVHPANRSICERLNGMPLSTMRRHLAKLIGAGMLGRRDSANGKRFSRSGPFGKVAFGLDLAPLLARADEIRARAEELRAEAARLKLLRESLALMRRDLAELARYGEHCQPGLAIWVQASDLAALAGQVLRRKPEAALLEAQMQALRAVIAAAQALLAPEDAEEVSISDSQNERHLQMSETDDRDARKLDEPAAGKPSIATEMDCGLPLGLVLEKCPEIVSYAPEPVKRWPEFLEAAERIRPMMGISVKIWDLARTAMGSKQAAVALAVMLERYGTIRVPDAYLRGLVQRAARGQLSLGSMLMPRGRPEHRRPDREWAEPA